MSSRPSPFQSPTTGNAEPGLPKTNTPAFGVPADVPYRSDHVAVAGLKVPMSSRPSPFQSPTTGTYAPKLKVPASAGPADAVERSSHRAVLGTKAPIPDDSSFRSSKASTDRLERPREVFRRTDSPP